MLKVLLQSNISVFWRCVFVFRTDLLFLFGCRGSWRGILLAIL